MQILPEWVPGRTFYHLCSISASGAPLVNPDVRCGVPCGRGLRRLQDWLGHVAALGCGGVLLTPVAVSNSHGYDTADPFRLDQRLGDEEDFADFVDACHALDLRVVLDGVFNHVGRNFAPFEDVLALRQGSAYGSWFMLDFSRDDGDGFGYRTFEGHHELAVLRHANDEVLDWACAVCRCWLERGADGWRLDAAYAIERAFLKALTSRVREEYPDAFLFGEMIHGDYAHFVEASGLRSVTQYELYKAMWSSLNDANFFELAWALDRHRKLVRAFAPVTFAGNHDVTRLASQLHDPRHMGHVLAMLLTLPGVPCVYYGDEFAWRGVKEHRPGGDDAVRPSLPASPAPADQDQVALVALHRELIALRRARPWLTTADLEVTELANTHMAYTVTASTGSLLVQFDLSGAGPAELAGWQPIAVRDGWSVSERA